MIEEQLSPPQPVDLIGMAKKIIERFRGAGVEATLED
jgi:hypothetical protein